MSGKHIKRLNTCFLWIVKHFMMSQRPTSAASDSGGTWNQRTDHKECDYSATDSDEDEDSGDDNIDPDVEAPPDGGWGWVVTSTAFLCFVILDGSLFSFGVFFMELLEYFKESNAKTAWVGSTLMGMHLIAGPFVSVLVNLFDCRRVAITGSIVATVALGISTVAPNVSILILTYGVVAGIGFSMIYIPATLSVSFYFTRKRALANGIAMCGSGIGTFIFAPMCEYLQATYTWRGALLILSAITLNCLPCSVCFRPLLDSKKKTRCACKRTKDICCCFYSKRQDARETYEKDMKIINKTIAALKAESHNELISPQKARLLKSSSMATCNITRSETLLCSNNNPCLLHANKLSRNSPLHLSHHNCKNCRTGAHQLTLQDVASTPNMASGLGSMAFIHQIGSRQNIQEEEEKKLPMLETLGINLLVNPVFLLNTVSSIIWTTQSTILTILPEYAVLSGISHEKAAFLLSIIGATNTVGRVAAGWLADRPQIDSTKLNATALLVGGIVSIFMPFSKSYALLATEAAVFGFCMATWVCLRPIVLVELLGVEKLTNAFGLLAMFQGIAFMLGPPMAGSFYDITQSYTGPFITAGVACICSGLLCIPLRFISTWWQKKYQHHREDQVEAYV